MDEQMDGWMDGWPQRAGWMDEQINESMLCTPVGWMDACSNTNADALAPILPRKFLKLIQFPAE